MMNLFLLSLCVMTRMAMHVNAESNPFQKPWFCHKLDCPRYTVGETTKDYEERTYEPSKWVSTKIEGSNFLKAQRMGFERLFSYINGNNEQGKKIPMTTPVRSFVHPGEGPSFKSDFTVSFFVPYDYIDNTPKPKSPDVFIEESPEMTVYVDQFGGWMRDNVIKEHTQKLIEHLKEKDIEVETETYYASGYDPPFRLFGRHNEIWLVKKAQKRMPV